MKNQNMNIKLLMVKETFKKTLKVNTVPADGMTSLSARTSAGTMMTNLRSAKYISHRDM